MATIAAINTNFTATTGNFEKGSKRVERIAASLGSRISSNLAAAIPGFGQLVSTAAIGLLVKRVADAFKRQFDELGNLMDQSINLGVPVNQLQSLRFAASQAGVSAEQLDTALARMKRTLPGVSIEQVAEAFQNTTDATKRLQQAHAIFGRSGVRLISVLSGGQRGLDDAAKKFAELGGTLSDLDVARADEAGDALDRAGIAIDNLSKQLAVNAAPGISLFADSLSEVAGSAANAARANIALSLAYLESSKRDADSFQKIIERAHGARAFFTGVRADFNKLVGDMEEADRLRRIAAASRNIAEGGPATGSGILEEKFRRILEQADEAARRAGELRGLGDGADADAAAKKAQRSITPAAVEAGTTAAIEAINKAARGGEKKEEKEANRILKNIDGGIQDVKRAIGDLNFEPADLE